MEHPVLAKLAALCAELDVALTVLDESRGEFSAAEITEAVRLHKELSARLDAVGLNLLAEAAATDVPFRAGAPSTAAWLSGLTKLSPHAAKERAATSLALENLLPDTKYALETGRIGYEQAAAIAAIITDLPKGATAGQIAQAEQFMLDRAPTTNGYSLRRLRKRVDDLIDPEGLLEREKTVRKKCGITDKDNHDGTHKITWTLTDERYAKWRALIEPLTAPRPAGADGTTDPRTREQRLDDAMNDLLDRVLRHGDLPTTRGHRPTVIVTIDADALRTGTGLGTTTTGVTLTAQAIQRIACDADIHPLHINGDGIPLKLGRTRRLASHGQWLALIARDGGCVGPDCTRPPEWCDAHHCDYWENLGPTDVDTMALLCDHHHDQVHSHGWTIIFAADGHPEFVPPIHIDPFRRPIRNTHWETLRGKAPLGRAA